MMRILLSCLSAPHLGLAEMRGGSLFRATTFMLAMIFTLPGEGTAEVSLESLVDEASHAYGLAREAPSAQKLEYLRAVRDVSDRIVELFPSSNEAISILLEQRIGPVRLADVNREIRSLRRSERDERLEAVGATYEKIGSDLDRQGAVNVSAPGARSTPVSPSAVATGTMAALPPPIQPSPAPFSEMNDKELMRQTQSALNTLGCHVGTADGVAGRKTRAGYKSFLKAKGLSENELPLGSPALLATLKRLSSKICTAPKAIALGPSNLSGQWTYRSRCGPRSRLPNKNLTGALAIAHRGGGNYAGKVKNSQGFNGDISMRVSGRSVRGVINWGLLLGRTGFSGTIAKHALILHGKDSLGCRMTVTKK